MRHILIWLSSGIFLTFHSFAQTSSKQLISRRTTSSIKIDGNPDEPAWKEAEPATGFIEYRPSFGKPEDTTNKTVIYILYDNTSIYVGGYCHERTADSISKELVGRDVVGVNDFFGIIFDTYNDKINASGFYVTPYGEQFDARYSNSQNNDEDPSWNSVWDSEAKIHADGWSFEVRIPYSALRFSNRENQTWGLNMTRRRNKTGQQYFWNPVDPKVNGFINQEGLWTGIEKIQAPLRLSFSPYFSAYLNHLPVDQKDAKDWTSSVNGGMDVKYGISEGFTLDMTLIPDFGQVRSDNQILNLSPFEVRYGENRPFFTEGTELFSKGNLFYSRRIGGRPVRFDEAYDNLGANEYVLKNPTESKLINATKISGRTKKGLGLGLFNALTKPMYATIQDSVTKTKREIQTSTLTNYNILVADQTLKNNSAISFINTNTLRNGSEQDANVSAALFNFNNKKNSYNWNGKFALSQVRKANQTTKGYSHNLGFGKTGGRWNFNIGEELVDDKYDINDMGILFTNNYLDHSLWTGYRWLKPTSWYNRIQVNYNAYYSQLYKSVPGQKINSRFQAFSTNVNGNIQLKNLWFIGMFVGFVPTGNDFYEPRNVGYSFRTPRRIQFNPWFETNSAKKYYVEFNYFVGLRSLFNSPNHEINLYQRYRFNDKFSLTHRISYNSATNDAGYYITYYENNVMRDIIFSRRNQKTIENVISAKYNFNNRAGISFRARHYWSNVKQKQLYDLSTDGNLSPTSHSGIEIKHWNFNIFNIDAVYTWQFAPGSFLNIVWKDESLLSNGLIDHSYFKNFDQTISSPQNNNLSVKVIYYLDYLDFKKWKRKKQYTGV